MSFNYGSLVDKVTVFTCALGGTLGLVNNFKYHDLTVEENGKLTSYTFNSPVANTYKVYAETGLSLHFKKNINKTVQLVDHRKMRCLGSTAVKLTALDTVTKTLFLYFFWKNQISFDSKAPEENRSKMREFCAVVGTTSLINAFSRYTLYWTKI